MPIAVPVNHSVRIRALAAKHPYLSPLDIAKLTGEAPKMVRAALEHPNDGKPKSRIAVR